MSPELMKSKFVRCPSACGIDYLWTYCMDFFHILVVDCPGPYVRSFFQLKKCIFGFMAIFFFLFVNIGPNGSQKFLKRYFYKSQQKVFKLLLNFPHRTTLGIFEISKILTIFNVFFPKSSNHNFSWPPPPPQSMVLTKLRWRFFLKFWVSHFECLIFNDSFSNISNSPLYPNGEKKLKLVFGTSDRRAKLS